MVRVFPTSSPRLFPQKMGRACPTHFLKEKPWARGWGISDEMEMSTIVINEVMILEINATRAFRSGLTTVSYVRGNRPMAVKDKKCAGTFSSRHRK